MKREKIIHPWPPVFDRDCRILILGTIPSPQSRKNNFYYGHPQNRFWQLLSDILEQKEPPHTIAEKKDFLLQRHIALWDVLKSCDITGASDNSIKNAVANDFRPLLAAAPIKAIFTTGKMAYNLYEKLCLPQTKLAAYYLPSTSPANKAYYPYDRLLQEWQIIKTYLLP